MYAVIMAGGRGTRFWPRSREKKPKHLLDIVSSRTVIQETVDRILPLIKPENILVVTGRKHARALMNQLPAIPQANIIIEPEGKNTAPCIGLAALHVRKKAGDDVMVVLPSDHAIADPAKFLQVVQAAAQTAEKTDGLVTIGIKPLSPQTGFGYIERGDSLENGTTQEVYRVKSIREKPDFQQAVEFVQSGNFYWNSGMFIWRASAILKSISCFLPDLYSGLTAINESLGLPGEKKAVGRIYKNLVPISIDYGVMEKADNIFTVKGDFGWSDVGSWDALWDISAKDENGNAFIGGSDVISTDSTGSLVYSPKKLVALAGVKDLIVVETGDALLICRKGNSQDVKKIVDTLEDKKLKKYL
ncbi:MAG: mannose-1-phosphate guanylyltransferase [Deltaproteobacteria bacterium HGW-Deltaproteobacteria-10]|nr:MAG: mannose-1-phosphate guanylyltransferase [Deltaproteobacteria bacterium HGW-Deltaproteobacteria-10]